MQLLNGRDLLETHSLARRDIEHLLELASLFKGIGPAGSALDLLRGRTLLLLFFRNSTRTRISFATAMQQLGGFVQVPDTEGLRINLERTRRDGEAVQDMARATDLFVDCVGIRLNGPIATPGATPKLGLGTAFLQEYARHSAKPVISLACDMQHPTQALADVMAMKEQVGDLRRKKLVVHWAYSPDVKYCSSIQADALMAAEFGMDVTVASPPDYDLDPFTEGLIRSTCARQGGAYVRSSDLHAAVEGADFVFPRTWVSNQFYIHKREEEEALALSHRDWRLTASLLRRTNNASFMHVMPFDRGNEVDDDVADGPNALYLKQAENLLHVRKAVLLSLLGDMGSLDAVRDLSNRTCDARR